MWDTFLVVGVVIGSINHGIGGWTDAVCGNRR